MKTTQPPERLNLRLPPDLKDQLQQYADLMGLSLNTAAILALRNFLPFAMKQARQHAHPVAASIAPKPQGVASSTTHPGEKVGRNEQCPCGSGRKAKHCHPENC